MTLTELLVTLKEKDHETWEEVTRFQVACCHAVRDQLLDNLQGCIQRAIQTRGWFYAQYNYATVLGRYSTKPQYYADIATDYAKVDSQAQTASETLLSAYLKALEAEG